LVSWSHRARVRSEAAFAALAGAAHSKQVAGNEPGIASTVAGTETSTGRCMSSRSPGSAATRNLVPTRPSEQRRARPIVMFGAPSNAHSPAGSTGGFKRRLGRRKQSPSTLGASNGLLRQYFPKGTDLRVHTAERIAEVAAELNAPPQDPRLANTRRAARPDHRADQRPATKLNQSPLGRRRVDRSSGIPRGWPMRCSRELGAEVPGPGAGRGPGVGRSASPVSRCGRSGSRGGSRGSMPTGPGPPGADRGGRHRRRLRHPAPADPDRVAPSTL
jgi:hypothetical protein